MQKRAVLVFPAVLAVLVAASNWPQASQTSHDVTVVNITVPVRVFDGDRFVDSLKLEDFEVSEDGRPQPVQAVYLIRGNSVERREGPLRTLAPPTARHFVLLFQMTEYLSEVQAAVDYFFDNVLRSGDGVDIITPRTTYRLKAKISSQDGLDKAKREVGAKVRQDTLVDSGAYNAIIKDLVDDLGGSSDAEYAGINLQSYALNLQRLEWLRTIELERMTAFAAALKKLPGAKHVFLFFQKERVPQLSNRALSIFLSGARSDEALKAMELMGQYSREIKIDPEAIRKVFADASRTSPWRSTPRTSTAPSARSPRPRAGRLTPPGTPPTCSRRPPPRRRITISCTTALRTTRPTENSMRSRSRCGRAGIASATGPGISRRRRGRR
jgi:hypothetical protein